jgi:FAD/FMN-containing dehydrogenase/Fe-S oxidoreductase
MSTQAQSRQLRDDLRGLFRGELHTDELTRALYSTDAGLFQIMPAAVACPTDAEDVQVLLRYCAEHQLPVIARGAATGVAGESLGAGVVVDLARHLNQIVEVGSDWVRVQPGVVLAQLNAQLAQVGRRFAPDPASAAVCTLGGMLANNASGSRAARHGYTRDYVNDLSVVWDQGDLDTVGLLEPYDWLTDSDSGTLSPRCRDIARATVALLCEHAALIAQHQPRTRYNRCGYLLHDVLRGETLDLARLLVGSEGTLGVFVEATLRTVPLPGGRGVLLLGFASLESALLASQLIVELQPATCDLLERRVLALARLYDPTAARRIGGLAEAVLFVEFEADSLAQARQCLFEALSRLQRSPVAGHLLSSNSAVEPEEVEQIWKLREVALPSLYRLGEGPRPVAAVEDVAVPVAEVPTFLIQVQDILQRHETTGSFMIHAATGQVHMRPFLDPSDQTQAARLWAIAEEVHTLALSLGGTVSTQHGTGIARTPWVARQYGPLYAVMRQLKAIFDPNGLLNPGKIIGPDPSRPAWPLRQVPRLPELSLTPEATASANAGLPVAATPTLELPVLRDELLTQASVCNGCGHCRTELPSYRMCPMFRIDPSEAATPRAKANLLRHILQEGGRLDRLADEDVHQVAQLCINCKMCASECPANVKVPWMMLEAKAAYQALHGMDRTSLVLARTESFAAIGSKFARLINPLLGNRIVRWWLAWLFGISPKRRLPSFATTSFLKIAQRNGWTEKPPARAGATDRPRVAYLVDVFANYNDPSIAEAMVRVLMHNGVEVYVPPGQVGCGMAPLAQGDVETAREAVQRNIRVFADLAREGYTILCTEPTAAVMLTQDGLRLADDPDAELIANVTVEATTFLNQLVQAGRLRTDFEPLAVGIGHHIPCHLKALGKPAAGPSLLSLIPGLRVYPVDVGCSGMAGTFGLRHDRYTQSLQMGQAMFAQLRRPRVLFGSTECGPCRLQMQEGTGKRTLHPVQYLALAYGLMPELGQRLRRPLGKLVD